MNKYIITIMMNSWKFLLALLLLVGLGQCEFGHEEYKQMISGYLKGLHVREQHIPGLISCISDDKTTRTSFGISIDKLRTTNFKNLPLTAETLAKTFGILKKPILEVSNCPPESNFYDRLFKRIYLMMAPTLTKRLMLNFISNPQQIFKDITDAIHNYLGSKFKDLGVDLGDIMHIVLTFATKPPVIYLADYLQILEGFFTGLNIRTLPDSILGCANSVPKAAEVLVFALKGLESADMEDPKEQIEFLKGVSEEMREMLETVADCAKAVPAIERLVKEVKGADMKKVAETIARSHADVFPSLVKAGDALMTNEYLVFGQMLGTILYQLFLADKLVFTV